MSAGQNSTTSGSESVRPLPELKKRRLSARQRRLPNFSLGERGESRAVRFLLASHYLILGRNIRVGTHEIDIIARDPQTAEIVFVEVKTRSSTAFGSPSAAVSRSKIKSLQIVARAYLRQHSFNADFRFDILAVLPNTIEHYQNVTWLF